MTLHVVVIEPSAAVNIVAVQEALNQIVDNWYRIAPGAWVVVSLGTSQDLYARLRQQMPPNGNIFVSAMDPTDRQGWMPQKFWDWLRQHE